MDPQEYQKEKIPGTQMEDPRESNPGNIDAFVYPCVLYIFFKHFGVFSFFGEGRDIQEWMYNCARGGNDIVLLWRLFPIPLFGVLRTVHFWGFGN